MSNVKVRFADNGNDRRVSDVQLLSRASVKRESGSCPTENHIANLTPLPLLRYFADDDSRFVAGRVLKRNVKIAVRFNFESNDAARQSEPVISIPVRSDC